MKLLANENFPRAAVERLRARGWDVSYVVESAAGISDRAVMRLARREGRVVLTFDRDYGELIYKHRLPAPAGVVFLRLIPDAPEEPGEMVAALLDDARMVIAGRFTVVTREGPVRQRNLPS